MFGLGNKTQSDVPPPNGVAELVVCVFDEKHRLHHHFSSSQALVQDERGSFQFLNDPERACDRFVLNESMKTLRPTSMVFSYGEGRRTYLHVLPFEK